MKKLIAPVVILIIGLLCILCFNLIGSEVTPDGQVVEPFFLIPIGALAIVVGFIWTIIALIKAIVKKSKNNSI